jgi:23S rRNA (cytidine1920-2'-O)/16S rRNA (cytidine1409-2'-O)-methyltransferase
VPRGARVRLDELVVARGLASSRSAAQALIMAGEVLVADAVCDKAGTRVDEDAAVTVKARSRFVSRGGDKLDAALQAFGVEVAGSSALDVGASTGGFVDCLLQRGAARVIALDVGKGQLDARLRSDSRVAVLEGINARYLQPGSLHWQPDLLTMDVSFISVTKVLPAVTVCMTQVYSGVVLVKPQFEAGPRDVGKGGIVRNAEVHRRVLREIGTFVIENLDSDLIALSRSAVPGSGGNIEFFFHIGRGGEERLGLDTLDTLEGTIEKVMLVGGSGQEDSI